MNFHSTVLSAMLNQVLKFFIVIINKRMLDGKPLRQASFWQSTDWKMVVYCFHIFFFIDFVIQNKATRETLKNLFQHDATHKHMNFTSQKIRPVILETNHTTPCTQKPSVELNCQFKYCILNKYSTYRQLLRTPYQVPSALSD